MNPGVEDDQVSILVRVVVIRMLSQEGGRAFNGAEDRKMTEP